jgi:hypothetical protein
MKLGDKDLLALAPGEQVLWDGRPLNRTSQVFYDISASLQFIVFPLGLFAVFAAYAFSWVFVGVYVIGGLAAGRLVWILNKAFSAKKSRSWGTRYFLTSRRGIVMDRFAEVSVWSFFPAELRAARRVERADGLISVIFRQFEGMSDHGYKKVIRQFEAIEDSPEFWRAFEIAASSHKAPEVEPPSFLPIESIPTEMRRELRPGEGAYWIGAGSIPGDQRALREFTAWTTTFGVTSLLSSWMAWKVADEFSKFVILGFGVFVLFVCSFLWVCQLLSKWEARKYKYAVTDQRAMWIIGKGFVFSVDRKDFGKVFRKEDNGTDEGTIVISEIDTTCGSIQNISFRWLTGVRQIEQMIHSLRIETPS